MDFHTLSRKELKQLQTSARRTRFLPTLPRVVDTCSPRSSSGKDFARCLEECSLIDASKLEMFVDELPDMPKILGTFNKKWSLH
ncbi:hypothetical protein E2542_SST01754 [Spatholobus suberectus]|nr:hypothetical protein E2542_SST01754 [Spatholobus suberectus]